MRNRYISQYLVGSTSMPLEGPTPGAAPALDREPTPDPQDSATLPLQSKQPETHAGSEEIAKIKEILDTQSDCLNRIRENNIKVRRSLRAEIASCRSKCDDLSHTVEEGTTEIMTSRSKYDQQVEDLKQRFTKTIVEMQKNNNKLVQAFEGMAKVVDDKRSYDMQQLEIKLSKRINQLTQK